MYLLLICIQMRTQNCGVQAAPQPREERDAELRDKAVALDD